MKATTTDQLRKIQTTSASLLLTTALLLCSPASHAEDDMMGTMPNAKPTPQASPMKTHSMDPPSEPKKMKMKKKKMPMKDSDMEDKPVEPMPAEPMGHM